MTNLSTPTAGWESWLSPDTRDQLIVIICQKQETSQSGEGTMFLSNSPKNGLQRVLDPKKTYKMQLCKEQLVKTTAQQPEGTKERGSCKDVTDPFGTQGKRSMTSMVKLCCTALVWIKKKKKNTWSLEQRRGKWWKPQFSRMFFGAWLGEVSRPAHTHPEFLTRAVLTPEGK